MTEQNQITFEQAYSRLEEILEKMNSGKLSLEESLQCYEEADKLIVFCNNKLSYAENRIETLMKNRDSELLVSSEGTPLVEPFSPHAFSSLKAER